ncbi:Sec-independent protein translocase subunit TatA [Luteimicrobium subarcticum]|uniref:Sec-independent protein translocase protein TatA n=1 Tax=Luteimicrobium subarcticum TaxID=620910 RepID=A0A2M8W3U0_9MICO|nr:Sec-independent protein translocase subunit TatA [Luteimicrobium subarcticum]PJI85560.1 TatA/E family protein of Tat protein translocase [Luteimicrobium subarcticum]
MKPIHYVVLLLVVLLLFGARRLPDLAKSVGQSLKIFKAEVKDLTDDKPGEAPVAPPATTASAAPASPVLPGMVYQAPPTVITDPAQPVPGTAPATGAPTAGMPDAGAQPPTSAPQTPGTGTTSPS